MTNIDLYETVIPVTILIHTDISVGAKKTSIFSHDKTYTGHLTV